MPEGKIVYFLALPWLQLIISIDCKLYNSQLKYVFINSYKTCQHTKGKLFFVQKNDI